MSQEEKNKKVGMVISGAFHLLLLLAFLFIIAWREPDPPLPEYGIELNFGVDNAGSGNVQPETPVQPSPVEEEAAPDQVPEEAEEELQETEVTEVAEESSEETPESTENVQESPDVVEQTKTETKEPVPSVEKETRETKKETQNQTKPDQPDDGAQGATGEAETPENVNQGDRVNAQGDQGDEQGSLDARALYGEQGGGGGPALSIVGWTWDKVPDKKDESAESGQVVIDFWIDEDGYVIRTKIVETGVSMAVAKFYEDQLRDITFSKTSSGTVSKPTTKGTVTFSIKAK